MLKHWQKFEDFLLKWGLVALLIALPLYPKFPLFNVPGTYVSVRAEDFLIAALSGFFFLKVIRNPKEFLASRINQAFFLFFIAGLVSVLSAILLTTTVAPHLALLHWARRIEYAIPFFIAALFVRKDGHIRFYIEALLVVSFFVFIYGVGQINFGFPVISTQNEEFSKGLALKWVPGARLHATFGGHYDLAAFLVLVFPLAFAYLLSVKSILGRIVIWVPIATSFWLLIASSSRISVVAYFLGVGATLWLLRKRFFLISTVVVSLSLVLTTGDLASRYRYTLEAATSRFYPLMVIVNPVKSQFELLKEKVGMWFEEEGKERIVSLFTTSTTPVLPTPTPPPTSSPSPTVTPTPTPALKIVTPVSPPGKVYVAPQRKIREESPLPIASPSPVIEDRSTAIRLNVEWPRAIRAFAKNPLLGTGYSSITLATDNDYLRLLGEVGILGFLAFLLIFIRLWKKIQEGLKEMELARGITPHDVVITGVIGATIGILINATFIDVFEASKVAPVYWALMGMAIGIIGNKPNK